MLELHIPAKELYNEATEEFVYTKAVTLRLEHSLVSIAKWEAKWRKPFLQQRDGGFSRAEIEDYVRCMTLTQNVDPNIYKGLTAKELEKVSAYMNEERTATTFTEVPGSRQNRQVVTSELIYYWMTAYQIDWEAQKWHLNRLLTLIRICNIKNNPEKKMSQRAIMNQNAKLNAQRRAAMKSRG